jgi:DnaJ-domain-containing protein 1
VNITENVKAFKVASAAYEAAVKAEKHLTKTIKDKEEARELKRRIINARGWERARLAYEATTGHGCVFQKDYAKMVGITVQTDGYLVRTYRNKNTEGDSYPSIYFPDAYLKTLYPGKTAEEARRKKQEQVKDSITKNRISARIERELFKHALTDNELGLVLKWTNHQGGIQQRQQLVQEGKVVDTGLHQDGKIRWATPAWVETHKDEIDAEVKRIADEEEAKAAKWEEDQERYTDFGVVADIQSRIDCVKGDITFIHKHWRTLRTQEEFERLAKGMHRIQQLWLDAVDEIDKGNRWFRILGVRWSDSDETIKKAYHRLAQLYHPDKAGGDAARFRQAKEAYDQVMKQRAQLSERS